MVKIADRTPDNYSISIPQILFNPLPDNGNFSMWVDSHALISALYGLTNDAGMVVNSFGNPVGTPDSIMETCFLGALDTVSLGGDVETLEHTVSNLGYLEVDRSIVLNRPYQYNITFDEPDVHNLSRYMVSEQTNLGCPIKPLSVTGTVFQGSNTERVTIFNRAIGDPAQVIEQTLQIWTAAGGIGKPPKGVYGFIIGGTNEEECVGEWANKRHWIAYAELDFDKETVGTWTYMRPTGTAAGGNYGNYQQVGVNQTCASVYDTDPPVVNCGNGSQWNVNATLAWSNYGWYGADEGFYAFSVVGTTMSFQRTSGCAVLAANTRIGISMVHVIPRCTLMADGSMDFSADQWQQGSFVLNVQRDAKATLVDRKPALPVPFGYMQLFNMLIQKNS